jgi:hypothetical protein
MGQARLQRVFGFIVAWNLWLFAILNMTNIGLQFTQYLGYVFGPRIAAVMAQSWVIALTMAIVTAALVGITTAGLQVGRWVHGAGGVLMFTIFAIVIAVPWLNVGHGTLAEFHPLQTAVPAISVFSLTCSGRWDSARSPDSRSSPFTPASVEIPLGASRGPRRLRRRLWSSCSSSARARCSG